MISIIMPVYNRSDIVEFSLDSIALQTLSQDEFEVIVVDDCSTDNTIEVLNSYRKIKNFRVISLEKNTGGPAVPRNVGIENASGKYVMFMDSDDIITQNALSEMANYAAQDTDFVFLYVFASGRKKLTERFINLYDNVPPQKLTENAELDRFCLRCVTILNFYKRDLLMKSGLRFRPDIILNEDLMFHRFYYSMINTAAIVGSKKACYFSPPKRSDCFTVTRKDDDYTFNILDAILNTAYSLNREPVVSNRKFIKVVNNLIHVMIDNKMGEIDKFFAARFKNKDYVSFVKTDLLARKDWLHPNTLSFLELLYAVCT
ncbi:MAG: glycosyltransferase family 2 protein [Ruminococcus sp.]|jgi:glycosyltransferase involved in cell wall biosynthesis|nr:glycosyltransferase family 2 protein [Ruminococcus sp.]